MTDKDQKLALKQKLSLLPSVPGVYLMKDERGQIIYVGKAISLKNRVRSYFRDKIKREVKLQLMVSKICDCDWIVTVNELEALILECNLIKKHRPKYNVRLKDDKSYPYIKVTVKEQFPRLYMTRKVVSDGAKYFGPYTDSNAVKEIVRWLRKNFLLRTCKHLEKRRPCLQYHIKRCLAPCAELVTAEDYKKGIEDICRLLCGYTADVVKSLKKELEKAATQLQFEQAINVRNKIIALQSLITKQNVQDSEGNRDVLGLEKVGGYAYVEILLIREGKMLGRERFVVDGGVDETRAEILNGFIKEYYTRTSFVPDEVLLPCEIDDKLLLAEWFFREKCKKVKLLVPKRGKKLELLNMAAVNAIEWRNLNETKMVAMENGSCIEKVLELQKALTLAFLPSKIECYDISHLQGTDTVASMVVFIDGRADKTQYRRFRLRTLAEGEVDDFKAMAEVIDRRCSKKNVWQLPDLIVIDGGKGQLSSAKKVLVEHGLDNISIISLAKRLEEVFLPAVNEPLLIVKRSAALRLLQEIRDEAHRFALSYHKKVRGKRAVNSVLDEIKGIGAKRKTALWQKFGSVEGLANASVADLEKVKSMNSSLANVVYEHLCKRLKINFCNN